MFIHYAPAPDKPKRAVLGPGDLSGKVGGHLTLTGSPDKAMSATWMTAIGAFVLRGGSVEWRRRD